MEAALSQNLSTFPMSRDWARRIVSNAETYLRTPPSVHEEAWATLRSDFASRRPLPVNCAKAPTYPQSGGAA